LNTPKLSFRPGVAETTLGRGPSKTASATLNPRLELVSERSRKPLAGRRNLYLFQAIPGLTLDRPPLVPGRRRRRRRQPKRRFEPKPLMPRAWGKPRRSPAIPRHRFCRGSGRPGHQTGRPKAGAGGIDGNKRCLTRKAEVKRPALHLQCRSAWRACRASSFRPHQLGAKDWRRGRDSNP
jgi:hypothetical protein